MLVEIGDKPVPFFVVLSGEVQALRPTGTAETLIVTYHAGQFSGEATMLSGRRSMGAAARGRAGRGDRASTANSCSR